MGETAAHTLRPSSQHRVSAGDCLLLSLPGRVPESGGDLPSPSASDASPGPGSRSRRRQSAQQQAAASGLRLRAVQDVSPVPSPSGAARTAARDGDPTARPDGPSDLLALAADRYALQVPSAWAMTAEASESTSGGRRFVAGVPLPFHAQASVHTRCPQRTSAKLAVPSRFSCRFSLALWSRGPWRRRPESPARRLSRGPSPWHDASCPARRPCARYDPAVPARRPPLAPSSNGH